MDASVFNDYVQKFIAIALPFIIEKLKVKLPTLVNSSPIQNLATMFVLMTAGTAACFMLAGGNIGQVESWKFIFTAVWGSAPISIIVHTLLKTDYNDIKLYEPKPPKVVYIERPAATAPPEVKQ